MKNNSTKFLKILFFIISLSTLLYTPHYAKAFQGIETLYATKLRKYFPKGRTLIGALPLRAEQAVLGEKIIAAKKLIPFDIEGTYHCTNHLIGTTSLTCTEPILTIRNNNIYYLGKEKGTYSLNDSTIILGSIFSIRGVVSDDLQSIVFTYYNMGQENSLFYTREITSSVLQKEIEISEEKDVIIPTNIDEILNRRIQLQHKKLSTRSRTFVWKNQDYKIAQSLKNEAGNSIAHALFKKILVASAQITEAPSPEKPIISQRVAGVKIRTFPMAKKRTGATLPLCDPTLPRTEQSLCK